MDYRFKIMYALGIIFVVAGHCGNGGFSWANWFPVQSFHLALFAFSSGYFYNREVQVEVGKYIKKKVKNLLVPLYIWNIFYAGIVLMLSLEGFTIGGEVTLAKLTVEPIYDGHQFAYNMGGWFVIPIFMVQIYNVLIRKVFSLFSNNINEWFFFLLNLILGMAGIHLASQGYNTGWWLALVRMLYFLPFYSLGILYKAKLEKYDKHLPDLLYFGSIFLIQLIIIYFYEMTPNYVPSWCRSFNEGPVLPFVAGVLGIAFWFRISKILEHAIGRNKYVNLIADNTYSIMIHQFMGFMIVKTIFGLIDRFTIYCSDFNMASYKSDIWYYYLPKNINHMYIIYFVAGIVFPIIIQLLINEIVDRIRKEKTINM